MPISTLLDHLDKSTHSNTAWLDFPVSRSGSFDLEAFLLRQLRSGQFHFQLIKNDLERGWDRYVSKVFGKTWETMIHLPNPGNVWNGNERLSIAPLTIEQVIARLYDLMTKNVSEISGIGYAHAISEGMSNNIIDDFLRHMQNTSHQLQFFQIEPDFLYTIDEYYASDHTHPGYFENNGKDFVLSIVLFGKEGRAEDVKILMTNGY